MKKGKIFISGLVVVALIGIVYWLINLNKDGIDKDVASYMDETKQISQTDMSDILSGDITDDTIDKVYIRLCEKCEDGMALEKCQEVEKNYWYVYSFFIETSCGGIEQFFINDHEIKDETLKVLKDLNLQTSYQYLNEALALYPQESMEMSEDQKNQLDALDDKYYELHEKEFYEWAKKYLNDHREDFIKK